MVQRVLAQCIFQHASGFTNGRLGSESDERGHHQGGLLLGIADAIGTKADMPATMSAVEGRADFACQGLSGPFIAMKRHWKPSNDKALWYLDARDGGRPSHQDQLFLSGVTSRSFATGLLS